MIFLAVAGPTPGRSSSSFWDAVFKSTFAPEAAAAIEEGAAFSILPGFSLAADFAAFPAGAAAGAAAEPPPTVTILLNLEMVFSERPALEKSETELYGRPAMIFFAVASPTPGSSSRSFWEAVFRSTRAFLGPAAQAVPSKARKTRASAVSQGKNRIRLVRMFLPPFVVNGRECKSNALRRKSVKQRPAEQERRGDSQQKRSPPDRPALRQRGDGSERDRDLEEGDGGGEAVMAVKELVSLARLLVPLLLLFLCLVLDFLLLLAVPLLLFGVFGGRFLGDRQPRRARRFRPRRLDPLGLVVGPLVRGLGLEPRRLGLQDERVIDCRARPQGGDRGERGKNRGRERDSFQERSAFVLHLFVDPFLQVVGLDLGSFRHRRGKSIGNRLAGPGFLC